MNRLQDEGLSALLIQIESDLEKAEAARTQLENETVGDRGAGSLELPQEALKGYVESAATRLAVALDIAGLSGSQAQLAARWEEFSKNADGVADTHFYSEVDWLECPALHYLQNLVSGIRVARGKDTDHTERYELNKLELMLEKIPHMLLAEGVVPQSEKQIRDVAHKYLKIYFTQYTTDVQIQGPVKPFKPDSGVINLKAAIEFKFATTRDEVHNEIGQLFEDTSGYGNSLDWKCFYFVLYQTQALISMDQLKAELEKPALPGKPLPTLRAPQLSRRLRCKTTKRHLALGVECSASAKSPTRSLNFLQAQQFRVAPPSHGLFGRSPSCDVTCLRIL